MINHEIINIEDQSTYRLSKIRCYFNQEIQYQQSYKLINS